MKPVSQLTVGLNYRVQYRLDGQRTDHILIGRYLGVLISGNPTIQFDMRPEAGTTTLPVGAIVSIDRTAAAVSLPRRSQAVAR